MGLDMYLTAELYVSTFSPSDKPLLNAMMALPVTWPVAPGENGTMGSFVVSTDIAYWRKANAVHAWFVRECQDGVDDCRRAYVSRDNLRDLRGICEKLLANKSNDEALEFLPPQSGFFFGSTDVDDDYWEDVADTLRKLDKIIASFSDEGQGFAFYYRASW